MRSKRMVVHVQYAGDQKFNYDDDPERILKLMLPAIEDIIRNFDESKRSRIGLVILVEKKPFYG